MAIFVIMIEIVRNVYPIIRRIIARVSVYPMAGHTKQSELALIVLYIPLTHPIPISRR